jgi:hypothetical protein
MGLIPSTGKKKKSKWRSLIKLPGKWQEATETYIMQDHACGSLVKRSTLLSLSEETPKYMD